MRQLSCWLVMVLLVAVCLCATGCPEGRPKPGKPGPAVKQTTMPAEDKPEEPESPGELEEDDADAEDPK